MSGNGWSATTNVAPSVATGYLDSNSVLAWKDASNNTIWYMNPLTLPGLADFVP